MNILVTGAAGFIGFHLIKNLIKNKKNKILGLDSLNPYYNVKIKIQRLELLKKNKNFYFKKKDLGNVKELKKIISKFKPEEVFHFAGQPGVLYSFKNPSSYKKNNIKATQNLCRICSDNKIKKFIFASSSSVYGDQKKFPIKEKFKKNPKNYYAKTKYECEKIVKNFFMNSQIDYTIYRFFTVYGPLGRPDMFIHKFFDKIKRNKKIQIYNHGKNYRDFTYIDDVIKLILTHKKLKSKFDIYNIARSKPIKTSSVISLIKRLYRKNEHKIEYVKSAKGEMLKTHGCNKRIMNELKKFKFTDFEKGLKKTFNEYKKYGC